MKLSTITDLHAIASLTDKGVDARLLELIFDHTPDIAFFIKDAAGRYLVVNESLVERHGLSGKSQMLGRRPCDVCPGEFGRIPTEQDAAVLRTGRPIVERLELHWDAPHGRRPSICDLPLKPWRSTSDSFTTR